ncbi:mediator of RNA polymerase II transcription subunit 17 [Octopus bimaculoides]|uniref:Mediator of RNA polymerase II transcription subunit 17 n=1 Tax=Octopus bimaculoides TaxID=37653 RepID=A0A0L8GZN5_OCTBM|nr:mediator of RNA polymerase II transcription subunit 17 [Octopus bimaculoides]|eukprot:XP_014776728.1 PREDICTED: mediator of RNA polymerase II transcription subunit 17-like [Octopus bimaculoides]
MATGEVSVSVESIIEQQIQEVSFDGQELCLPPLSMSENLTKLAHKIDFYRDESEEKGKPTSEGEKETDEKVLAPFQPSLWPWDSVRNKLKIALTEISVLNDVVNIAKERRYMILDHVVGESNESRVAVQLLAKKRSLVSAAAVLVEGTERLKKSQQETSARTQSDFHIELLKLRHNWRLKKVGNTILGDFSYKSVGSRYWQSGTFEVVKSTKEMDNIDSISGTPKSCLEVIIPSELEGVAYVKIEVKTFPELSDLTSVALKMPSGLCPVPSDTYWHQKLEVAQNVLFCKELFSQLAREAVQLKSQVPHMVVGNQIITNIFPGVQLSIVLCHYNDKDKRVTSLKVDHNHVLEHSLHQLLREAHYKTINHSPPHPVTVTLGLSKRRRLAGPHGYSRQDLTEMTENETLLEQIIQQTKHAVLRKRVMETVDRMAIHVPDPQISTHWSCLNSSLESSVKINITSLGYEINRTSLVLEIGTDTIKAISRDGRVSILSFEPKELEDLLMWQIAFHHLAIIVFLSKLMGWQILSSSNCVGVGQMEPLGTASSITLGSPKGDKLVCIRSGAATGQHVYIQSLPHSYDSSVVTDPKWKNLEGSFQEVNLDKLVGRSFIIKIEFLMATLMS